MTNAGLESGKKFGNSCGETWQRTFQDSTVAQRRRDWQPARDEDGKVGAGDRYLTDPAIDLTQNPPNGMLPEVTSHQVFQQTTDVRVYGVGARERDQFSFHELGFDLPADVRYSSVFRKSRPVAAETITATATVKRIA